MSNRPALGSHEIRELLDDLGRRLQDEGITAEVYLVGGSAIALSVADRRTTHDLDAVIEPRTAVLRIAHRMASERGLPEGWLNSSATPFVPPRRPTETGWRTGSLTVHIAPAEHLLAMKLIAGRDRDLDDIRTLADALGVTNATQAADIVLKVYGEGQLDMHGGYANGRDDAATFLAVEPPDRTT